MRGKFPNVIVPLLSVCATIVLSSFLPSAFAQTPARRQSSERQKPPSLTSQTGQQSDESKTPRTEETSGVVDLSITAHVTAESLRFEKVPNPNVEFTGRPRRDTVWDAQRENLPEQVRPGVTYRNIGITLRITSVFADIDRIVAEALGETPASDDARPQGSTPERPAAPPQSQENFEGNNSTDSTPTAPNADTRATQRRQSARRGRTK